MASVGNALEGRKLDLTVAKVLPGNTSPIGRSTEFRGVPEAKNGVFGRAYFSVRRACSVPTAFGAPTHSLPFLRSE